MSYTPGFHISFTKQPPYVRVSKLRSIGDRIVFTQGQFDRPEPAYSVPVRVVLA